MSPRPLLLIAIVMAAAGCGWNDAVDSRAATAGLPDTRQLIQEHDWVLDPDDSSLTAGGDGPMTLTVVGDDISGMAGCNAYRGDFSLGNDDSVDISDIAQTARDCGTSTMRAEAGFLTALEAVDTVETDEDHNRRLVLHDDDHRLVFRSYDMDELLTATWSITDVATGDTIDSIALGTEPTLTFGEDGQLTMAMTCTTANSRWELDGHSLSVDTPRVADRPCTSPPGVVDQEAALVRAIASAHRVEIVPGELTILDADDSIALVAVNDRHG